jgi:DNA-binding beta-propeller fold protein YncE
VPAGSEPTRELWVTSQGQDSVFVLSFPDGEILDRVALPATTQPHITTFSPDGSYAYVSGMGNGELVVLRADDRKIVGTLPLWPAGVHQAKASPDGSTVLVSVVASKTLVRLAADEAAETWVENGSLSLGPIGKAPICTVFRNDGQQAYVSLQPSGIAIIDMPSLSIVDVLPTDGFIACGMIKTPDGSSVVIASSGGGGHIYTLDLTSDQLLDRGTIGAADWHSFNMTPDGALGFGTSPASDELVVVDLTTQPVTSKGTLHLSPLPGEGANQPDALGGGDPIVSGVLPVSLRAAGQLAFVDVASLAVRSYLPIASPAQFNQATCVGCAVHGVSVRPGAVAYAH